MGSGLAQHFTMEGIIGKHHVECLLRTYQFGYPGIVTLLQFRRLYMQGGNLLEQCLALLGGGLLIGLHGEPSYPTCPFHLFLLHLKEDRKHQVSLSLRETSPFTDERLHPALELLHIEAGTSFLTLLCCHRQQTSQRQNNQCHIPFHPYFSFLEIHRTTLIFCQIQSYLIVIDTRILQHLTQTLVIITGCLHVVTHLSLSLREGCLALLQAGNEQDTGTYQGSYYSYSGIAPYTQHTYPSCVHLLFGQLRHHAVTQVVEVSLRHLENFMGLALTFFFDVMFQSFLCHSGLICLLDERNAVRFKGAGKILLCCSDLYFGFPFAFTFSGSSSPYSFNPKNLAIFCTARW